MSALALLGGTPVLPPDLPPYPSMGEAEEKAALNVIRSGCLSGFYGEMGEHFLGGPRVKEFEAAWAERFGSAHAISVNSATSGLIAAMGAAGVGPGDEVIVPPWTMSATAMAPLVYGAVPVFADIEDTTFCIDPAHVSAAITDKTRAVIAVNLFGHPARLGQLRTLCDERGLVLVEDNAQAPLASEDEKAAGTVGHMGVFSLNFHKHIHTGEGGMCVTDDDGLAARLRAIRNHGENATETISDGDLTNMVGMNLRMTELSAAIGLAQLANIDAHVEARVTLAEALSAGTGDLLGWTVPAVREGCRHVYYVWAIRYDSGAVGVSRRRFSEALAAEGLPHFTGYVAPLYTLPLFQERKAIGRDGFPFTLSERRYGPGLCPVTERLHESEALLFEPCAVDTGGDLAERLVEAVRKVHDNRADLIDGDGTP